MKDIASKEKINYLVIDKDDTLVPLNEFKVHDKRIHKALN